MIRGLLGEEIATSSDDSSVIVSISLHRDLNQTHLSVAEARKFMNALWREIIAVEAEPVSLKRELKTLADMLDTAAWRAHILSDDIVVERQMVLPVMAAA